MSVEGRQREWNKVRTEVPLAEQLSTGIRSARGVDDEGASSRRSLALLEVDRRGTRQRGGSESSSDDRRELEEHC